MSVNVVDDDPTAAPPTTRLGFGTQIGPTATLVRVDWPAATDPTSAIAGYEVERSINEGPWGETVSRSAATRFADYTLTYDAIYRFRVRAVDTAGNWSPWAVAGTSRFHPYDDRSSRVERVGTWRNATGASAFRQTLSGASRTSSKMRMTFTGHSIAIVASRGPHRGKARIYVDGVYIKTITTRSATSASRRVVFTYTFAAGGDAPDHARPDRDRHLPARQDRCIRRGTLADCKVIACPPGVS